MVSSYDGAKVCELVGIQVLSTLTNSIPEKNSGLYRDDSDEKWKRTKKPDRTRKEVNKIFKEIDIKIKIQTSLKVVEFVCINFNLFYGTYKPYTNLTENLTTIIVR